MAQLISIPYTILADEGITLAYPDEGPTATVKFKTLWTDQYQLAKDLIGTSTNVGGTTVRTEPFAYPGNPSLYCKTITSVRPIGPTIPLTGVGLPWITKKWAITEAVFKRPLFSFNGLDGPYGQPWTTIQFGASGEFVTLPDSTYRFTDGTPTNTPIGKVVPQIEINVKRYFMPYLPVAEMAALVGKINNAVYRVGNYSFPAGTLLFMGGPSEFAADTAGNITQEVEYKLVYRPINWNKYFHPNRTTGWDTVTDGSGNSPYESGNFATLP